jgi:hypothetical protein
VKIIPITTRNTETKIHASIKSSRYRRWESLVYLNEKIKEFDDHAIEVANVIETAEKETRDIIA